MGIESEIREALINLILNAIDAVAKGGRIDLRTSVKVGAPSVVRLEVSDNGVGMDEETRRRCIEPFFTTKGERGTGLGLGMVYGVMQRHDAEAEIESAPGHGTTMRLLLPCADPAQFRKPEEVLPTRLSGLRLLLVDDDPILFEDVARGPGAGRPPGRGGQWRGKRASRRSMHRCAPESLMPP